MDLEWRSVDGCVTQSSKRQAVGLAIVMCSCVFGALTFHAQAAVAATYGNADIYEANASLNLPWWGSAETVTQRYGCTTVSAPPEDPPPSWCPYPYNAGWHQGIDIGMPSGTTLVSQVDGYVAAVQTNGGCGLGSGCGLGYLAIKTANGNILYLLHGLPTSDFTSVGKAIKIGDQIYTTGANGQAFGPHLHFEVHLSVIGELSANPGPGDDINPEAWLLWNGKAQYQDEVVAQRTGTVQIFFQGADSRLWWRWYDNTNWHGANPIGPATYPSGANLASEPSADSSTPGIIDVFWKGTDGNLWHVYTLDNGGSCGCDWIGPEWPGHIQMGPLGGMPHAIGHPNGQVDVFWVGAHGGDLWHDWYDNTRWNPPAVLASPTPPYYVVSGPSAVISSTGIEDVFWEGSDGNLWHDVSFNYGGGTWSGPEWPGNIQMGPLGASPHVVAQSDGRVDVFWKGTGSDPHVWRGWYTPTTGMWNGPVQLWGGQTPTGGSLVSDPYPAASSFGVIDVFWWGQDNNLWHVYTIDNGAGWSVPGYPGNIQMGHMGSGPRAVGQTSGTIDVAWKGPSGDPQLYHAYYFSGTWFGAQPFGGSINNWQ